MSKSRKRGLPVALLILVAILPGLVTGEDLASQYWSVLSQEQLQAIIDTVSGETARDHIRYITQYWRWAPSQGFHDVGEYVVGKAKSYGLADAHMEKFLADRETLYLGAPMHRPYWDPRGGELWVVEPVRQKITSFADVPMSIAGYSRTTDVAAEVVDVGVGASAEDYAGKNVRGKIVLGTGSVGALQRMAVFERGALGVLSAWTPEFQTSRDPLDYPDQVTWGTGVVPESRTGQPFTFGFMLSQRQRQELVRLLQKGQKVVVRATVQADFEEPGYLEVVTATIPGREFPEQEIVFSAHLEHPKPAANDNTSGSATILEVARVLQALIKSGELAPPKRTIRFLWVEEGRSTRAYLDRHPELRKRVLAVINMDIVGNDQQKTKAILYLWGPSASHPSFAGDVVQDFFELVRNTNNDRMPTEPLHPILAPTGNRRPFIGKVERFFRPSDHSDFVSVGIPGINFAAWPDEFHHTPFDTPDKSDPTQLERVAFIGAASGAALAWAGPEDAPSILTNVVGRARVRLGEDLAKGLRELDRASADQLAESYKEARNVVHQGYLRERQTLDSIRLLARDDSAVLGYLKEQQDALAGTEANLVRHIGVYYKLRSQTLGLQLEGTPKLTEAESLADKKVPSWTSFPVDAHALLHAVTEQGLERPRILRFTWDTRGLATPFNVILAETLNFVDGRRTIKEIRDAVSAEFYPVPLDVVNELMDLMKRAGLVDIRDK